MTKVSGEVAKEKKSKVQRGKTPEMFTTVVFDGRSRGSFLSNYFIEPDGTNVQFEFQLAKCQKPEDRARFHGLTAERAKSLGHKVKIRPDWTEARVEVMKQLVRQKFIDHPVLLGQLAATGTARLIKRSSCTDSGWGMNAEGEGQNMLGRILMGVRNELCQKSLKKE